MTEPSKAVFLSYASQDAEAARRICEALRAAGIEVWFDQSELRGGDAWDHRIRQQIHDCALFIPIISTHTQERLEGYFRLEWKLAVDRSHLMAVEKPFLVPIVIDGTTDHEAHVPEPFRATQWTRVPGGEAPPAFCERIAVLLTGGQTSGHPSVTPVSVHYASPRGKSLRWLIVAAVGVLVAAAIIWQAWRLIAPRDVPSIASHAAATVPAFAPSPHSIAVLPFVNMSGDKEQEYFSEGLTEEVLNSLSRLNELQVAARTSSFSFQGEHPDIATVAHKLNVGAVLEGSVRRSAHTVRITAQLVNGVTGFHLWSQTYDRDLGDVLKLQTEIANAVASALKVTLLGDVTAKIELGGTRNAAAFDAYLRGLRLAHVATNAQEWRAPIDAYTEAIQFDPNYALAFASRALALSAWSTHYTPDWLHHKADDRVRADAERAIALAPGLADGHVALSSLEADLLNFSRASQECGRALALAPSDANALYYCSSLAASLGQTDTAISDARRGVALDPLNPRSHRVLGDVLHIAHRYEEALAAYQDSIAVDPEHAPEAYARRGVTSYLLGNLQVARTSCEVWPDYFESWVCQAMTYDKLGRHGDAASALASLVHEAGDAAAYQYVQIYTQWGNQALALGWLEKALRIRDPGLIDLRFDPLLDPLRTQPRFKAVERALTFPP